MELYFREIIGTSAVRREERKRRLCLNQGRSQTQNFFFGGGGANIFWENKISEVDFIHFYEN